MLIAREKEHEIRIRAYSIWEHQGRPQDTALANWLQAEAEVGAELDAVAEATAAVTKTTKAAPDDDREMPEQEASRSPRATTSRAGKTTSARTTRSKTAAKATSKDAAETTAASGEKPAGKGTATTPRKTRAATPKRPRKK
jgi:hypothetical protein